QPVPVRLVAVQREVLEGGHHALTLDAVDLLSGEHRTQVRVFGVVLEVAAVARVARKIAPAGELDIEAAAARLPRDRLAALTHELRVEARSKSDQGRERCGARVVRPIPGIRDAHAGVAALNRRNPEP